MASVLSSLRSKNVLSGTKLPSRREGGRHFSMLATMLLLLGAGCRNGGWSADEVKQFYGICAGGRSDANCVCLARELPKLIPFAAYAEFVAASKGMSPHKLNDDVLRKMAHAAVICTSR